MFVPSLILVCYTFAPTLFHVCSMFASFSFHVCSMFVSRLLNVRSTFAPCLFHACSNLVPCLFQGCSMFVPCLLHVLSMSAPCSFHVCSIFVPLFFPCSFYVSFMFVLCLLYMFVPRLFHIWTCSRFVPLNLSLVLLIMFKTFPFFSLKKWSNQRIFFMFLEQTTAHHFTENHYKKKKILNQKTWIYLIHSWLEKLLRVPLWKAHSTLHSYLMGALGCIYYYLIFPSYW